MHYPFARSLLGLTGKKEKKHKKHKRRRDNTQPDTVAPWTVSNPSAHAKTVAAAAALRKRPAAAAAALKRPAAAPPPRKRPAAAAVAAAKAAAKPEAAEPEPAMDEEEVEEGAEGLEIGEEEGPPEVDEEVEADEAPEGGDEVPDRFEIVDRDGTKWDVKCGRRGYEKMSTLCARSVPDEGKPTPWRQHLQFNDKVWTDVADEEREKLSNKAIKDTC